METFELAVTGSDHEEICYSVIVHVPFKAELMELLPSHMDKVLHPIKCHTGPLAGFNHKIIVCLFRECNEIRLGVFTSIEKQHDRTVTVKQVSLTALMGERQWGFQMERCSAPKNMSMDPDLLEWYDCDDGFRNDFWKLDQRWHDDVSRIHVLLHAVQRSKPKMINKEEENFSSSGHSDYDGSIMISPFFMNPQFSDFTLVCGDQSFPAHRMILSTRAKHFENMFASNMKEVTEGTLKIKDMTAEACKELLRFIYLGQVENLQDHVTELFIASNKYGMNDLKGLCERELHKNLCVENALEIYDLGKMHESPVLVKKAEQIILSNRSRFVPDAETLKSFTNKYPDLVFQLFTMSI